MSYTHSRKQKMRESYSCHTKEQLIEIIIKLRDKVNKRNQLIKGKKSFIKELMADDQ